MARQITATCEFFTLNTSEDEIGESAPARGRREATVGRGPGGRARSPPAAGFRSGRRPARRAGAASSMPLRSTAMANRPSSVPAHAPPAAEDRRPAQHHGRDRRELVAGAGVGLGLAQVRHVDDRRQARRPGPRARTPTPTSRSTGSPAYRAPSGEKPMADSARPAVDRCSNTQNAAATATKIGTWVGMPPIE